jgi:hypothetical protein
MLNPDTGLTHLQAAPLVLDGEDDTEGADPPSDCGCCQGTGHGMWADTICGACHGSGRS